MPAARNPLHLKVVISCSFHQKLFVLNFAQCAIIPRADDVLGEKACLFVVMNKDQSISLEAICQVLEKNGVAKYKRPEELHTIDAMPMTPTNKVRLDELVRRLEQTNAGK